jgi:hypothetical protein
VLEFLVAEHNESDSMPRQQLVPKKIVPLSLLASSDARRHNTSVEKVDSFGVLALVVFDNQIQPLIVSIDRQAPSPTALVRIAQ